MLMGPNTNIFGTPGVPEVPDACTDEERQEFYEEMRRRARAIYGDRLPIQVWVRLVREWERIEYRYDWLFIPLRRVGDYLAAHHYPVSAGNIGSLFIAWLNHINFNVCHDMYARAKRDYMVSDDEFESWGHAAYEGRTPEDEVVEVDHKRYIMEQVMALPITESQAIVMHYYQGMTLDEIADALNMSRSSVKRYLKAGKDHLRRTIFR